MNQLEKMFVVKAATNKIGATRAHNLYCSMKGGYEYVHGTTDDFKNHQRDVNQFIGESDAQMLINKMENRKKYVPNFTFQYKVENFELVAMFWADEVAKCLFWESQEIPFESLVIPLESYEILLESHVILLFSHFESHEISMESEVIHIEIRISLESQMIHVESQVIRIESHVISLESHICKEIYNETDFKECFDKIIWNMFIEPLEFEEKYAQLIEDFCLQSHKWLKNMFNLREIWIPAYFIDSPLYGLMRTTSRSESENSFFKSFTSPGATLVSFMMSYESAMERQRYRQESLDFKTIDAAPKCITQLDIELHAARVYTRTMFLIVQTEINEVTRIRMKINHFFSKKKEKKGKEQEKKIGTVRETAKDYKVISMESQMIHVESHEIHIESHVIYLESHVIHIDQ
ncbi:FAR1-related sequence 5-like protein [Tanacetum coccineum]